MKRRKKSVRGSRRKRLKRKIKRKMIGPAIAGTTLFTTMGTNNVVKGNTLTPQTGQTEFVSDDAQLNVFKKAVSDEGTKFKLLDENLEEVSPGEVASKIKHSIVQNYLKNRYDELQALDGSKPSFEVYQRAVVGYTNLKAQGKVKNEKLTVIDFSVSSQKKRLWIIDMQQNKVVKHKLVAHGKNSGFDIPDDFSNTKNSNKSSLGFYLTGENYHGKYGLSLRLDGQEEGFNSNARKRAVVMHRAKYVNKNIIKSMGRLGRSFGCPALNWTEDSTEIMKDIADQSVMYIYSPQGDYLSSTELYDLDKAFDYLQDDLYVPGQGEIVI